MSAASIANVLHRHAPNVDIQEEYEHAHVYRIWCDATGCEFTTDGIGGEARVFEAFAAHQAAVLAAAGFGHIGTDMARLLAAVDNVEALASAWEARAKHLMNYSGECPESVKHALYEQGEEMADNARKIRAEVAAAFTRNDKDAA